MDLTCVKYQDSYIFICLHGSQNDRENEAFLKKISNKISRSGKEKIDESTGEVIWKERYQLSLGTNLFKQMLIAYKNSLQRKRPKNYKKF